jgi:hypothetical protein
MAAIGVGALFTAQILLNPFYVSLRPGEHTKSGPLRVLPIELTLLHDLPVAQDRDRMRKIVGPPVPAPRRSHHRRPRQPEVPADRTTGGSARGRSRAVVCAVGARIGHDKWVTKPSHG